MDENDAPHSEPLIPSQIVGFTAILCAAVLVAIAVLGPIGLGAMEYKTSQSNVWQVAGQDIANLGLMAPLLLIGGALCMAGRPGAKYFLILTPITLMYTGLSIGIGQEWSNPAYAGNAENYWYLFLALIIGGLVLLLGVLPMFSEDDAPTFKPRNLRVYVGVMTAFLLLFAAMWTSQILQVTSTGGLPDGSYEAAPTVFWTIRYLDLGVSIPVGLLALFLMQSKPRRAYSLLLLFFGFGITLGTAVNAMAVIQVMKGDPSVAGGGLIIFPVLAALFYGGLIYLVKDKIRGAFRDGLSHATDEAPA